MKRMVVLGLVVLGVYLPAARAAAQEAGAAGADVVGEAGADNAGAGAGGGAHGGSGGGGAVAAVGGKTSYDLLKNDAGQACSIGHGRDSGGLVLALGGAGLLVALRRRRGAEC